MPSPSINGSKTGEQDRGQITVAVGAVILDENNRVLLVKHVEAKRGGFWFGKWICPGGKLVYGESITEGTKREISEETGLEIELLGRPVVFDRIVRESNDKGLHVIYVDHLARKTGGDLKAGSDVGVARWFTKPELGMEWAQLHVDTQRLLVETGVMTKLKESILA